MIVTLIETVMMNKGAFKKYTYTHTYIYIHMVARFRVWGLGPFAFGANWARQSFWVFCRAAGVKASCESLAAVPMC